MGQTSIEWTEHSWNPVVGCTKISPGCTNCYALRMAIRLAHNPKLPGDVRERYASTVHKIGGKWEWSGKVALFHERLEEPLKRRNQTMYFVPSMGDLFHEDVPMGYIGTIFDVMRRSRTHTFQVLTKRPERMLEFQHWWFESSAGDYLSNIWLGVTAENQRTADERIPVLLQIPAAVRFVSCEPLLGTVDLRGYLGTGELPSQHYLDWVICGGESGPGARPMHPDWARSLVQQCEGARVPVFVKQMGTVWAKHQAGVYARGDTKGHNIEWWPSDLRIRQMPQGYSSSSKVIDE